MDAQPSLQTERSSSELLMRCSLLRWLGRLCILQADLYVRGRHRIWAADVTGGISRYRGSQNPGLRTHVCYFVHLGCFLLVLLFKQLGGEFLGPRLPRAGSWERESESVSHSVLSDSLRLLGL